MQHYMKDDVRPSQETQVQLNIELHLKSNENITSTQAVQALKLNAFAILRSIFSSCILRHYNWPVKSSLLLQSMIITKSFTHSIYLSTRSKSFQVSCSYFCQWMSCFFFFSFYHTSCVDV